MEENHHLLRPLLSPSTTTAATSTVAATVEVPLDDHVINNLKLVSSHSSIIFRLSLVMLVGIVSIWANHEASKGYDISIVNESSKTFLGARFQLFYVSNDEATRIVIKASKIVENFLYPDDGNHAKKQVSHIMLKLVSQNLTNNVIVESGLGDGKFVLNINPSIMESSNFRHDVLLAVQQGVARVWLWNGRDHAPKYLINGIVEYMTSYLDGSVTVPNPERIEPPRSSTTCWKHDDSNAVAEFLNYCELYRPGFIIRLNQAMKDGWDDGSLDGALGLPANNLCTTYESLRYNFSSV